MSRELRGAYSFEDEDVVPAEHVGIDAVVAARGLNHPRAVLMRLHAAYRKQVPPLLGCQAFRTYDTRLGLCVRPRGHTEPCRFLMLSAVDSAVITAAARRATGDTGWHEEPGTTPKVEA